MSLPITLINKGVPLNLLNNIAIATGASATFALPSVATQVTWQTEYPTPPGAVQVDLQTSLDGSSWTSIDSSTDVDGESKTLTTSAVFVRADVISVTGGDFITVIIVAKAANINEFDASADISFTGNDSFTAMLEVLGFTYGSGVNPIDSTPEVFIGPDTDYLFYFGTQDGLQGIQFFKSGDDHNIYLFAYGADEASYAFVQVARIDDYAQIQLFSTNVNTGDSSLIYVDAETGIELRSPIIFITTLPTADPHKVGQLWNSTGVVHVSAG